MQVHVQPEENKSGVDYVSLEWEGIYKNKLKSIVDAKVPQIRQKRTNHQEDYDLIVAEMKDINKFLSLKPRLVKIGADLMKYEAQDNSIIQGLTDLFAICEKAKIFQTKWMG